MNFSRLKAEANRYLAEMIGTFFLVLNGCGAAAVNDITGGALGHAGVSAVFGLTVMIMIYSLGNISGAHLNPGVSFGFFLVKKLNASDTILYSISQFLGAIAAGLALRLVFPVAAAQGLTLPSTGVGSAIAFEVVLTMLLMFVILNVSTGHMEKGIMAGVAVGGTVAVAALVGGPLTGASMNPARSLGPALAMFHFDHLWIYFAGPYLGVVAASPFCNLIQRDVCCSPENLAR